MDILEANPKSNVYYTEDCHAPGFHSFHSVVASKDQASQSPMIVFPDGRAVWESTAVLTELFDHQRSDDNKKGGGGGVDLYPAEIKDEILALEKDLGQRVGASLRCIGYYYLFGDKKYHLPAAKFLSLNSSKVEQFLISKMIPMGMADAMFKLLNINDEVVATATQDVRDAFAEMSDRLEKNGGKFLMGDKYGFTAADLTLSALSYFAINAPQVAPLMLSESELPPGMVALGKELQETPAGQHVLKMYSKHRPVDESTGQIAIKNVDQNRVPWPEMVGATGIVAAAVLGIMAWAKA